MQVEINKKLRTEFVTINVGANNGNNSHNFGQLPNIRDALYIKRVESFSASSVAITLDGKTVISDVVLKKSFLKLVELGGSNAEIHVFPLWDLNQNASNLEVKDINCQAIDWEKSGVYIADTTGLNANESFAFKIVYEKKK